MKTIFTDDEILFEIKILERGWINEVYLVLGKDINHTIQSGNFNSLRLERLSHTGREEIQGSMYSEFNTFLSFPQPISYMEYCFFYSIGRNNYRTDIKSFMVKD